MITLFRGFRAVSLVSLCALGIGLVGCGLLKKKGGDDPGADAEVAVEPEASVVATAEPAEAAPPPVVVPTATNENDVSRFPDEQKLDNVVGTLLRPTNVREIPGIGDVVASLAKGGTVTQLAQRDKFFLVLFENPKDKKALMGWVGQEAFTAVPTVAVPTKTLKCLLPETALISDAPFCGKVCTADTDCPKGQACKGHANRLTNGAKGDAVGVCTVFGAAPPVVDAAAPVKPPTAATDAAAPAPARGRLIAPGRITPKR